MGKNKPRHNPNKQQNQYGDWCPYADEIKGKIYCEGGGTYEDTLTCKGNRHNCVKVKYKKFAGSKNT